VKRITYRSLRAYLDATHTTQEQLAQRIGVSQAHLSMLLSGQRKPSVELALLIERETGVSVRDLVEGAA
jgi:transcriptional regulator with XRE-family HTH domain